MLSKHRMKPLLSKAYQDRASLCNTKILASMFSNGNSTQNLTEALQMSGIAILHFL